ncbi:MAG: hypothetical protein ACR2PA_16845 [Hyphomicrobiaceae bacterium]
MAEPRFTMTAEEDLPRTLRREKEARAREREAEAQSAQHAVETHDYVSEETYEPDPVTVTRLNIPFLHLMVFFIKAVFAAIPAMLIFVVICVLIGEALQAYIPELRQFELIIRTPLAP